MKKQKKLIIDSFIDGMSSFDIMPSCDFELEDLSLSSAFNKVGKSFEKVGNIMYQIIDDNSKALNEQKVHSR